MGDIFLRLINMSISASWLILVVVFLRLLLKKAPKWVFCLLWGMVAIRLICPFPIESVYSLVPDAETISYNALPSHRYTDIAGIAWCCGMLLLLVYAIISQIRIRRMVKEAVLLKDNIYICDTVKSPFILGIVRPHIYLSSSTDKEAVHYVIAHEQAHLNRRDHLWKPLGYLLLAVYWLNPFCWIAYILLCRDIEFACDEKVIRDMTLSEKKEYSKILLSCSTQRKMIMACPLAFGEISVKERVKSVLYYKKTTFGILAAVLVICVIVSVCFLTDPPKEYKNRTAIPAGNIQQSHHSEEEINHESGTLIHHADKKPDDTKPVLRPTEGREESVYVSICFTPDISVKMEGETGSWVKNGAIMQNLSEESVEVYVPAEYITVRVASCKEAPKTKESLEKASIQNRTAEHALVKGGIYEKMDWVHFVVDDAYDAGNDRLRQQ